MKYQKVFNHAYLPDDERNNDLFKIGLCHQLKSLKYHSKSKSDISSIFTLYNTSKTLEKNTMKLQFPLQKKLKAISCNKICAGKICFETIENNSQYLFCLYKDKDIGFNKAHSIILQIPEDDDDIETDEEELKLGHDISLEKFTEDMKTFKLNQLSRKIKFQRGKNKREAL